MTRTADLIRLVLIALVVAAVALLPAGRAYGEAGIAKDAMQAAREALYEEHGDGTFGMFSGERFEVLSPDDDAVYVWEAQGWYGGDLRKLWFKTEGEYADEEGEIEELELQVLFSRAVHPFWNLQAGLRHDVRPEPSRNYAVLGLQGVAPYWFEVDAALFLSDEGDLSARVELEYELRMTRRVLLQPRIELSAAASDDEEVGAGSGLARFEAGLRLRYEITPQLAPYVGVSWTRAYGETADWAEDVEDASLLAGIRFWF